MASETAFMAISENEDSLADFTQIFKSFSSGIFVPFDYAPGVSDLIFRFNGWR